MSKTLDNLETEEGVAIAKTPGKQFWGRFFGLAVLGALIAIVAVAGGSTIYCQSFGGIVLWTLFASFWIPIAGLTQEPAAVLWPLAAYLLVVFVVARCTRFRPTPLNFAIAVVLTYAASIAIDWALGWTGGVCALG